MPLDFDALSKKHKEFRAPQFIVRVDGTKITPDEFPILQVSLTMSASLDMGTCEFVIAGVFDAKNGCFDPDIYTQFKPGRVVTVQMGYAKPVGLFKGYINALNIEFNGEGGPYVTVQCLDAKGALVNNMTWNNYGGQSLKAVVTDILQTQCGKYANIGKINVTFDESDKGTQAQSPEIKEKVDDYVYLKGLAEKTNSSFCVLNTQLYFCANLAFDASVKSLVELKWGKSLLTFSVDIDISQQVGAVKVFGDDPVLMDTFMATCDDVPGAGESGAEMAPVVKKKTMYVVDGDVSNQEQATALAKSTLLERATRLVRCKGSTIGIPELIAGKKVKITGMGKGINGEYFLDHVTHRISSQGYVTSFEGSSAEVAK